MDMQSLKRLLEDEAVSLLLSRPDLTYAEIADRLKVSKSWVCETAERRHCQRGRGKWQRNTKSRVS